MKKYIIGFVLGVSVAVSGSVFAWGAIITPMEKAPAIASAPAVVKLSANEIRFRLIEARLYKLEHKK